MPLPGGRFSLAPLQVTTSIWYLYNDEHTGHLRYEFHVLFPSFGCFRSYLIFTMVERMQIETILAQCGAGFSF